jgi:hypothetical protein
VSWADCGTAIGLGKYQYTSEQKIAQGVFSKFDEIPTNSSGFMREVQELAAFRAIDALIYGDDDQVFSPI